MARQHRSLITAAVNGSQTPPDSRTVRAVAGTKNLTPDRTETRAGPLLTVLRESG